MSRFFVTSQNVLDDTILIEDKRDIHHISKVLRLKPEDEIDISDSCEWEYRARILSIEPDQVRVQILDKQKFAREPALSVTLFQGIPKQGKMEVIIQKTVEAGVSEIVPVFTDRTIVSDKGNFKKKLERWQNISDEAVKQCKRGIIPNVCEAMSFAGMLEVFSRNPYDLILFPYENEEERNIKQYLRALDTVPKTAAIIIGPEGGFSEKEAEALKAVSASVTLGKTILRTETAGLVALAMIMYELELA